MFSNVRSVLPWVLLKAGPRPMASCPRHTSRPADQWPASQFTSCGPVLNFGQRYFTGRFNCFNLLQSLYLFVAFCSMSKRQILTVYMCIRYSYVPKNIHIHITFFLKIEIAKKPKLTFFHFWNTYQNMCCKIPLTKIVNWTPGCKL